MVRVHGRWEHKDDPTCDINLIVRGKTKKQVDDIFDAVDEIAINRGYVHEV